MTVIQQETSRTILGVEGLAHNVVTWHGNGNSKNPNAVANQMWRARRTKSSERVDVEMRFDDNCRNGHQTFAITCDTYERTRTGWRESGGGAAHDTIAEFFPELAPLIRWHLTSQDGPMHYLSNTKYLAGDLDYNGRRVGDPARYGHGIRFGDNPILHSIEEKFWDWLQEQSSFDFEVIDQSEHKDGHTYRGYTVGGYPCDSWHHAPFKSEQRALEFVEALCRCKPQFIREAVAWSEGKPRELDAARRAAVWPEATDEQLSLPRAELDALLRGRLPGLVAEFRRDMVDVCGFVWLDAPEMADA